MKNSYDLAIIGSGFGGSLLAMIARRLGLSVLMLERGKHPRFAIGESTSPLANLILEDLAWRYDLPNLIPLCSYGSWQRSYRRLGCGLKRGFTYFHHEAGQSYRQTEDRSNQLLVAASPCDEAADTHWLRADVDQFFMQEARTLGAECWEETTLTSLDRHGPQDTILSGVRQQQSFQVQARLVVDASGPGGFLSQALSVPNIGFNDYPATQTLYSHFVDILPCAAISNFEADEVPPYPMDAAAVHHVFDGGWMWQLRFDTGVVSAGIAVTDSLAQEIGLSDGAQAWPRFLARYPTIAAQFADAKPIRPFVFAPRLAYRAATAAGPGWAMLPSAASFVDPLFSTGIPLTLLGIERLGRILETSWGKPGLTDQLECYSATTLAEADVTADFLSGCYSAMSRFPVFAALSMFYFAAASYSEMARRLDVPCRPSRFLASDHPEFGPSLHHFAARARKGVAEWSDAQTQYFITQVGQAIDCLNVAGLSDPEKRNWYGVDLEDVIHSSTKLGRTSSEMRALLHEAEWAHLCP